MQLQSVGPGSQCGRHLACGEEETVARRKAREVSAAGAALPLSSHATRECSKAKVRLDFLFSWSTLKAARAYGNYDVILQALLLFQTGTVISHVSYVHQHVLT